MSEENRRKTPKRLVVNMNEEDHKEIKQRALDKNITIRAWIGQAIKDAIAKEKQYE